MEIPSQYRPDGLSITAHPLRSVGIFGNGDWFP